MSWKKRMREKIAEKSSPRAWQSFHTTDSNMSDKMSLFMILLDGLLDVQKEWRMREKTVEKFV